jgi:hypothetical protein
VNKRPPGYKALDGERIWVAEVGYGIYAEGRLVGDPILHSFGSIEDLLNNLEEIPVQDDPYVMALIRRIHGSNKFSTLNVLAVKTEISDIGSCIEVPKELRTQGSWFYLKPGQIDLGSKGKSLELSPKIPGAVRLRVYQRLARKADRHMIDVDHFVPKVVGGPGNIEENLVPISYSLNRAKSGRIPSGLFDVAASFTELRHLVPQRFAGKEPTMLNRPEHREAAKKVVAAVNGREDLNEI